MSHPGTRGAPRVETTVRHRSSCTRLLHRDGRRLLFSQNSKNSFGILCPRRARQSASASKSVLVGNYVDVAASCTCMSPAGRGQTLQWSRGPSALPGLAPSVGLARE